LEDQVRMASEWILGRLAEGHRMDTVGSEWRSLVNTVMNLRVLLPHS
jgi:hypothetical protein